MALLVFCLFTVPLDIRMQHFSRLYLGDIVLQFLALTGSFSDARPSGPMLHLRHQVRECWSRLTQGRRLLLERLVDLIKSKLNHPSDTITELTLTCRQSRDSLSELGHPSLLRAIAVSDASVNRLLEVSSGVSTAPAATSAAS